MSGFTGQLNSQGEMNPSSLWPQPGIGDNVGGEVTKHSLQEGLEPSRRLGSHETST